MDLTKTTGMDSRSIAEIAEKNHADVCRDIRKMIDELGEDESKFASVYQGGNGESRRCYILPKRHGGVLIPAAAHMDAGRFEVKTGEKHGHAFHQTRFTPEGIAWIAKKATKCG